MNKLKIAQYIALGATALSIIGAVLGGMSGAKVGTTIMCIGFAAGVVSYIFGGFGTAIRMAGSIAKWGWKLITFPACIATFAFAFMFAIIVFVYIPIIPVRKAYKESISN